MARLLSILLQRSDPGYPWGFTVRGGLQDRTPLIIDQVKPGTLAAQYLAPGDTILQIDKVDTRLLNQSQVESVITQPTKSLDLLVLKGQNKAQYSSSDSGSASSTGGDPRVRKQNFWERVSSEKPDSCREGFTKLNSGVNSLFKERQARLDRWRRCQSEEKSNTRVEDNFSESGSHSSRVQSVWSPTPDRLRQHTRDYQSQGGKSDHNDERQGDITFWEVSPERQSTESTARTGSLNRAYKRHNSDFSYEHASLSSEYATTPRSNFTPGSPFDMDASFTRKSSDFWGDHYRDQQGRLRFGDVMSTANSDNVWKSSNISSKSEFKKSTSISEKSFSSAKGAKSFETVEQVNKTKEVEKSSKTLDGGKEEVVEKTKKNKEYILTNKDDMNGQPQETKKVINNFKVIERVIDGENEFCNKVNERSEEVTNSSTPVNFYDNVQQQGVAEGPPVQRAEWCDHSVNRQREMREVPDSDSKSAQDGSEVSSMSFSPLLDRDPGRSWASSTPLPATPPYDVYIQEEPLIKNYFEVDIRSPLDTQLVYSTTEEILR